MKTSVFSLLLLFPVLLSAQALPAAKPAAPAAKKVPPAVKAVPPEPQPQPPAPYDRPDIPGYCIFGAQSGKPFDSEAAFKTVVWKSDVVYIGEDRGRAKDHLAQLEALKSMKIARGSKIAVGFAMISSTLQPVLDDYAAGRITEEEFLAGTEREKGSGFDFNLYKPLFDLLITSKLRALALDVPPGIVSKIAREGLTGLDAGERKLLPEQVNITKHKKYLEYLKTAFGGQANNPMTAMLGWDNYLASISARNEGMGAKVADFINANPGWSVLVVTGNEHIIYNASVPASVKSRTAKVRQASFYTEYADKCPAALPKEHKDRANYLWYIGPSVPAKAKP